MAYAKPIPEITPAMQPFFEGTRQHELRVQRCTQCETPRFPSRPLCSNCLSTDSDWIAVSGKGVVLTFAVMHQVYHPGFADEVPYTIAMIRLAEGPKMLSNIVETPPGEVYVDMPVEVVFEDIDDRVTLPKFRPA